MSSLQFRFPKTYYRILSFDGGGIRGILTATLLKRLEEKHPKLIENTDLFVGSSVGSFIALALANGISLHEIIRLFSVPNSKKIFEKRRRFYLFRPKYSNKPLKKLLSQLFSDSLRLKDLPKNVVITSFKLYCEDTGDWEPVFFNNFPSSKNKYETVVSAALSSSAAPIYFPSYNNHIDGGIIVNNPDTAAISFAAGRNGANRKLKDIVLLSFGTGYNPLKITSDTANWGLAQWAYSFRPKLSNPKYPILDILTDGVVESDTFFSSQLLQDRYFRLNPRLFEQIKLDDYEKIPTLIDLANQVDLAQASSFVKTYWTDE